MDQVKFYQCKGGQTILLDMGGNAPHCDSEDLTELTVNTIEAAVEKHIPVLSYDNGNLLVEVGSTEHPMEPEHYITWIFVQTRNGGLYRHLTPEDHPMATFHVKESEVLNVYAYCNLHGLWKANIDLYDFCETVCSPEFPDGCTDCQ